MKKMMITTLLLAGAMAGAEAKNYVGGDISLLPLYEQSNAQYKDELGQPIPDFLQFCYDEGMNVMRVRLFVDPQAFPGTQDPNACQTLEYILPLCQQIKKQGFALMLDFHYSDTWADPGAQYIPEAWKGETDEELIQTIYEYTKESLETLVAAGATPDFIQPGNEISYGTLWAPYQGEESSKYDPYKPFYGSDKNWDRFTSLLKSAIKACKEVCPDAKTVIHTERVADVEVQNNLYRKMAEFGVDYDIIGLSYYPYFHGTISVLDNALTSLETNFPSKDIMIVETGYPYAWEVPGSNVPVDYPYSYEGQNQFAEDLVKTLEAHSHVNGLIWWWMEYNAFSTNLTGWYNAPLFDSYNGQVTPAFKTICSYGKSESGIETVNTLLQKKDEREFDLSGRPTTASIRGIVIKNKKKIMY